MVPDFPVDDAVVADPRRTLEHQERAIVRTDQAQQSVQ